MTDQEITRVIAEKVMGFSEYTGYDDVEYWETQGGTLVRLNAWNPLATDHHCMAAWDKFSEDNAHTYVGHVPCPEKYGEKGTFVWRVTKGLILMNDSVFAFNKDRRRAMCECMAMAARETPTEETE